MLKLSVTLTTVIKWWVDTAYSVHNNMQSIDSRSTEQKLNTKISTEAELV